jgi:tetratricopeptide (TPR) repeat protein
MTAAPSRLDKLLKLLQLDPNDAFVLYGIAQEHAKGGAGGHERAVEYYDRCIAADPQYCYAYYHKAMSLQALSKREAAREAATAGLGIAKQANDGKAISELAALLNVL